MSVYHSTADRSKMKPAIRVQELSKRYRLGRKEGAGFQTLRDTIADSFCGMWNGLRHRFRDSGNASDKASEKNDAFWALKDVSFEVRAGEVVGIIGRNGAGKSTLLKILSQITEPTAGRCEIHGRMASMLEVGTGFHPELTGRENIYLNGSLLGMSRKEINRKFDEIVAFSEIEQFLDTPVKRYSSGMYVRLAFAVAAHLEPEILVIDEVLAVGDAGFQQRCFQKMREVRDSGRTVVVVSHNLGAIRSLCTQAINLEQGQVMSQGDPETEIAWYLGRLAEASKGSLIERKDREGSSRIRVAQIVFLNADDQPIQHAITGEELRIHLRCLAEGAELSAGYVALSCWTMDGIKVFHVDNVQRGQLISEVGLVRDYVCRIPRLPLLPGHYYWNVAIADGGKLLDHVYSCAKLEVLAGDYFRNGQTTPVQGGFVLVDHSWV